MLKTLSRWAWCMHLAAQMQSKSKENDLKVELLLYPMPEINCQRDETRLSPSGSNAVVMWASGLGSSQTTPSTSTQAAPAPRVDCSKQMLCEQLELLTIRVMERCYDC
jgi:hypothetical protein